MYPGAKGHESELGGRDQDATAPLIADAENLFAVLVWSAQHTRETQRMRKLLLTGDNNVVDIVGGGPK